MPRKKRPKDARDFATKQTLNPSGDGAQSPGGAPPGETAAPANPPSAVDREAPAGDRTGQFTGRGSPGLQKK
ncbi:MAG TPA: hypothetical protein VH257_01675 [Chloroflexota bacterium]|nr:hypothetical protein [Chloroflexota bacterium]